MTERTDQCPTFAIGPVTSMRRSDYFVSSANELAYETVMNDESWPLGKLVLVGPASAGKTHLAQVWAKESGAQLLNGRLLEASMVESSCATGQLVVDDVDEIAGPDAELALLRIHNILTGSGGRLLMTAKTAPTQWRIVLPDLRSRLEATLLAFIPQPDDELLEALLVKQFVDRQLRVDRKTIAFLIKRIERSFKSVASVVARLDSISLADRRPVTRTMASRQLRRHLLSDD